MSRPESQQHKAAAQPQLPEIVVDGQPWNKDDIRAVCRDRYAARAQAAKLAALLRIAIERIRGYDASGLLTDTIQFDDCDREDMRAALAAYEQEAAQ